MAPASRRPTKKAAMMSSITVSLWWSKTCVAPCPKGRAGGAGRRGSVGAFGELTGQEAKIGHLAAAGRGNPKIGVQLFLSPRTVERHPRSKVFMELGVSSRRELASALGETGRMAVPG
jgi:DNA-binding NarL/FixJ family response regulator